MQRKINIVTQADMQNAVLFADMDKVSAKRLKATMDAIETVAKEREAYEAQRERIKDGVLQVAQSDDIIHVQALIGNEAFARMVCALKIDPRSYLFPQSQPSGKSSSETSNLKSYRKVRQIAEVIWSGSSDLENVAKVVTVCAHHFAVNGKDILTRDDLHAFLSSHSLDQIDEGTRELFDAVDDVRAKHMAGGGADTQAGQMVRTLVALKSAEDVRDGRKKHVRINPQGLVMQALMTRFGRV